MGRLGINYQFTPYNQEPPNEQIHQTILQLHRMSTELLHYCLGQLRSQPKAINITQALTTSTRRGFIKTWASTRFLEQQYSIIRLSPDHPEYGRSYLWHYDLHWATTAPNNEQLRIQYNPCPSTSPRELILLASVTETAIPFVDADDTPIPQHVFRAAKSRMLGGESKRAGGAGAVFSQLRPAVANVQYLCQDGSTIICAVNLTDIVNVEY